jgi:hypothetical protein
MLGSSFVPRKLAVPCRVTAAFQSSKLFEGIGNLGHLLTWDDGRAIKAAVGEHRDVPLECFLFEGTRWELSPTTAFYDYLYLRALCDTFYAEPDLRDAPDEFTGFTNIAYNPKKSFNCQARSSALFVALGGLEPVQELVSNPQHLVATMKAQGYQYPLEGEGQLTMF